MKTWNSTTLFKVNSYFQLLNFSRKHTKREQTRNMDIEHEMPSLANPTNK